MSHPISNKYVMLNKDLPFVFRVNADVFSEFSAVFLVLLCLLICCCVFGLLMCTYGPPGAFGRLLLSQNVRFDVDRPLDLAN